MPSKSELRDLERSSLANGVAPTEKAWFFHFARRARVALRGKRADTSHPHHTTEILGNTGLVAAQGCLTALENPT